MLISKSAIIRLKSHVLVMFYFGFITSQCSQYCNWLADYPSELLSSPNSAFSMSLCRSSTNSSLFSVKGINTKVSFGDILIRNRRISNSRIKDNSEFIFVEKWHHCYIYQIEKISVLNNKQALFPSP